MEGLHVRVSAPAPRLTDPSRTHQRLVRIMLGLLIKYQDKPIPPSEPLHIIRRLEPRRVVEHRLDRGERGEHDGHRAGHGAREGVVGGGALAREGGLHRGGGEEGEGGVRAVL
jgi:hypothetical protein